MPRELVHALRVSVDGLRPWEYWASDADDYDMTTHLQRVFRAEMETAREMVERQTRSST
jgi:hypothetical protein